MGKLTSIISGTFICILAYLFLVNYRGVTSIVGQLGSTYSNGVKTLQGR